MIDRCETCGAEPKIIFDFGKLELRVSCCDREATGDNFYQVAELWNNRKSTPANVGDIEL